MSTINVYQALQAFIDGSTRQLGSRDTPVAVSIAGLIFDVTFSILNESGTNYVSQVLWTTGNAGITSFDLLAIVSDNDVIVEFRNDNATDQFTALHLEKDIPLIMGGDLMGASDDATSIIGSDGSATTLDNIDMITAKNNADGSSTSVTANVRLMLFD